MKHTPFFICLFTLLVGAPVTFAADDLDEVKQCLRNWKTHPFKAAKPEFRTVTSKVKVMGVGGALEDDTPTKEPELVLLKPAVNVMSKSVINLMNPNGWYCLKGKVDVLGKTEINLHCQAHLASTASTATVLGSNEENTGVTVLGKSVINRLACP